MNLEKFTQTITFFTKDEAQEVRNKYISKFIDTSKEHYEKYIKNVHQYIDGFCYTGYLWDCLRVPAVVDFAYVQSKADILNEVFVLWDIHTKERIFIDGYWKFGKDSILKMEFKELLSNLEYLPEDIYIFDKSFEWTMILTHEYIDEKRWCLKTGNI